MSLFYSIILAFTFVFFVVFLSKASGWHDRIDFHILEQPNFPLFSLLQSYIFA